MCGRKSSSLRVDEVIMVVGVGVLAVTGGGGGNFRDGESVCKGGLVEREGFF